MYALTLSVGQKDKEILEKIKSSFGVGKIYYDTSWKGYNYVVCSRKELDVFMEPWPWAVHDQAISLNIPLKP
jgi:hypothetical protein